MNKFFISGHARHRMIVRKVSVKMIKDTILKSESTGVVYFGRLLAFKYFPGGLLKVVYVIKGKTYFIISVIWANKKQK